MCIALPSPALPCLAILVAVAVPAHVELAVVAHAVLVAAPAELLFCGRLLIPLAPGRLGPVRHGRTFHWPRQLLSLERLRAWIPSDALPQLASGSALGALRGERLVPFSGWQHVMDVS